MNSRLIPVLVVLALVGAAITGYLTMQHGRGVSPAWLVGHGCAVIASSKYAHIGILPTASLGLLSYLLLALLSGSRLLEPPEEIETAMRYSTLAISFIGTAFSAWLMYVAISVLHASCIWCIGSATTMTLIFVISLVDLRLSSEPGDIIAS